MCKSSNPSFQPESVIDDYFEYVSQYQLTMNSIPTTSECFWPRLQNQGLLIELALKTYLCACRVIASGHDLERLARKAVSNGLLLSDEDWVSPIHTVNVIYFKHRDWNTKYLSRYPTPDRGLAAFVTPQNAKVDEMVRRIIEQAISKRVDWKRPQW
jgi:hypothetical protein